MYVGSSPHNAVGHDLQLNPGSMFKNIEFSENTVLCNIILRLVPRVDVRHVDNFDIVVVLTYMDLSDDIFVHYDPWQSSIIRCLHKQNLVGTNFRQNPAGGLLQWAME